MDAYDTYVIQCKGKEALPTELNRPEKWTGFFEQSDSDKGNENDNSKNTKMRKKKPIGPEIQLLKFILPLWRRGVITTTKLDEGTSQTSTGFRQSRPEEAQPDFAVSNRSHAPDSGGGGFDEDDYASLQARYLMPHICKKVELAGGITV